MWKCPFCETINDEDSCVVCGELRPMPSARIESNNNNQSSNAPESVPCIPHFSGVHIENNSLEPTPTLGNSSKKPKKKWIWIVTIIVLLAVIGGFIAVIIADNRSESSTVSTKSIAVGDYITFGKYEQDNNLSNGKEDIEWLVLAKGGDKALIISKHALDCKKYNEEYEDTTWAECTLRAWLNDDFYNIAFSQSEKSQIEKSFVSNKDNSHYGTDGGIDTYDNVFLLSRDEAYKYFNSAGERECDPTPYAIANGVWSYGSDNCFWWLRSPGYDQPFAEDVSNTGDPGWGGYGSNVDRDYYAVRPVMWITLA